MLHRFEGKRGECRYCSFLNKARRYLGLRHPMLPTSVWHNIDGWTYTTGYAVLNRDWIIKLEEKK